MSETVILAEDITKRFGEFEAVKSLSLNIPKASIYGFLGPNGSGKSTTIRMLTGLLTPSEGRVEVLGFKLPKYAEKLRLKIGYMTQKFSLYNDLTVKENLHFVANIYGLGYKQQKKRIEESLDIYGLEPVKK